MHLRNILLGLSFLVLIGLSGYNIYISLSLRDSLEARPQNNLRFDGVYWREPHTIGDADCFRFYKDGQVLCKYQINDIKTWINDFTLESRRASFDGIGRWFSVNSSLIFSSMTTSGEVDYMGYITRKTIYRNGAAPYYGDVLVLCTKGPSSDFSDSRNYAFHPDLGVTD
jgi:hypothetical protein